MSHTYSRLLCHIVFSTKCRYPLIGEPLKDRLLSYLGGIVRGMDSTALAINGTADHVHLLVLFSPKVAVADAIVGGLLVCVFRRILIGMRGRKPRLGRTST